MASVATAVKKMLIGILSASTGVNGKLSARLEAANRPANELVIPKIADNSATPEIFDRAEGVKYPQLVVYCERVRNSLQEKFNTFSGTVDMVVEIRNSQDRLDNLETTTENFAEAVAEVLDDSRGDWGNGIYYTGTYEVKYEPVKQGGRNFLQVARVRVPVEARI